MASILNTPVFEDGIAEKIDVVGKSYFPSCSPPDFVSFALKFSLSFCVKEMISCY